MNSTWKAVLGILAVFIFGWLAGALSTSVFIGHRALAVYRGGPAAAVQVLERRMTRNLNLDATQQQQIHGFFTANLNQRVQLQKQIRPQIQSLNQQTIQQINGVLNAEQAAKFRFNLETFKKNAGRSFFVAGEDTTPAGSPPSK